MGGASFSLIEVSEELRGRRGVSKVFHGRFKGLVGVSQDTLQASPCTRGRGRGLVVWSPFPMLLGTPPLFANIEKKTLSWRHFYAWAYLEGISRGFQGSQGVSKEFFSISQEVTGSILGGAFGGLIRVSGTPEN